MRFAVVFDTKDQEKPASESSAALSQVGEVTTVTTEQVMDGILSNFETVVFPGSPGSWYGLRKYGQPFIDIIHYYVSNGCSYMGVCGGAYIAAREPLPEVAPFCGLTLKLADVKAEFPPGLLTLANYAASQWQTYPVFIQFVDNPIIRGHTEIVEIAYNSGPVMSEPGQAVTTIANFVQTGFEGKLAIIATTFGKGRVILCSPHPESSYKGDDKPSVPWLYPKLAKWVAETGVRVTPQPASALPTSPAVGPPLPKFLGLRWTKQIPSEMVLPSE